jgi:hypothetical protein
MRSRSLAAPTIALLALGACSTTVAVPVASQPACESIRLPENPQFGGWSVDKFVGRFSNGAASVTVSRIGDHRLVIDRGGQARDLATENLDSWLFTDACGSEYRFMLPTDGPGAWLKITDPDGTVSDWIRG